MDVLGGAPNGVCRRPIRDEEDPGTIVANPVSAIRVLAFCQQFDCLLYRGAHRRVCGCGQRRCKEVLDRCEVRFDTNWAEGYDRNIHPLRSKRVGEQLVPEELEPFIKLLDRLTGHRTRVVQYQDNGASVLRIVYKLVTAKWRLLKGILCHAFPRAQNTKTTPVKYTSCNQAQIATKNKREASPGALHGAHRAVACSISIS